MKPKSLLLHPKPLVFVHGDGEQLKKVIPALSETVKQKPHHAFLDLSVYPADGIAFLHLLEDLVEGIGDEKAAGVFRPFWGKVVAQADAKGGKTSERDEQWVDRFAANAVPALRKWLRRIRSDEPRIVVITRVGAASTLLIRSILKHLLPVAAKTARIKFIAFYEGDPLPPDVIQVPEPLIHAVSLSRPRIESFENPYIAGKPVHPAWSSMYAERRRVMDFIRRFLHNDANENALVITAERRMGKTSLLLNLERRVSDTHFPVFINAMDFDRPKKKADSASLILWKIAFEICLRLRKMLDTDVQEPETDAFIKMPNHVFRYTLLEERVAPLLENRKLLLMFDEFERMDDWIREDVLDIELFEILRNVMQNMERVDFIFAGTPRLKKLSESNWVVLFSRARFYDLEYLHPDEALELIETPVAGVIEYTPAAVKRLLRYSGYHPYFTQLLCAELVNRAKRLSRQTIDAEDVDEEIPDAISRGGIHLDYLWKESTEAEKSLLIAVVRQTATVDDPYSPGSAFDAEFDTAAQSLEERGIIERRKNGAVAIRIGLFYEWIQQNIESAADSGAETISAPEPPEYPAKSADIPDEKAFLTAWLRDGNKLKVRPVKPELRLKSEGGKVVAIKFSNIRFVEYAGPPTSYSYWNSRHKVVTGNYEEFVGKIQDRPISCINPRGETADVLPENLKRLENR